jgi:hypothetical protein
LLVSTEGGQIAFAARTGREVLLAHDEVISLEVANRGLADAVKFAEEPEDFQRGPGGR